MIVMVMMIMMTISHEDDSDDDILWYWGWIPNLHICFYPSLTAFCSGFSKTLNNYDWEGDDGDDDDDSDGTDDGVNNVHGSENGDFSDKNVVWQK